MRDSLQIMSGQIAEAEAPLDFQILFPFEQQPARFLQHGRPAFARHAARFSGPDLVERLVHLRYDVKAVKDMQSLGALLADDP